MSSIFFASPEKFREWLEKNHQTKDEISVGYYKIGSGKPSMTWPQSVDEALCYGWIDGVRRSIDAESYCIRFTPRRKNSIWSNVNIAKVQKLMEEGRMKPEGIKAFENRSPEKSGIYSFEKAASDLPDTYLKLFRKNKIAWKYFESFSPSKKKAIIHWILDAKQEVTRIKRLNKLIADCEQKKNIDWR